MDARTTETSSSYGEGHHASLYRASITGKVPRHKGTEGERRVGWAGQLGWAGEGRAASHLEEVAKGGQAVTIAATITELLLPTEVALNFSLTSSSLKPTAAP